MGQSQELPCTVLSRQEQSKTEEAIKGLMGQLANITGDEKENRHNVLLKAREARNKAGLVPNEKLQKGKPKLPTLGIPRNRSAARKSKDAKQNDFHY